MKSLFKRTIAAASSSVLVLSQIATVAANVNVSAADSALVIDKKFVLDVPVDENAPLKSGQVSEWNDKAQGVFLAYGAKTVTVSTEKAKNVTRKYANKAAAKYGHISSAEIDEILAGIGKTAEVVFDGEGGFTATATCSNVGPTIGKIAEDELAKHGFDSTNAAGDKVEIDWSGFVASGKLVVEGTFNFNEKTFTYKTTLIDENDKSYVGDKGIEEYATKKATEAYELVLSQRKSSAEKTTNRMNKCKQYVADKIGVVRELANAIASITVSGTDIETVYTDYTAAVEKAVKDTVPAASKYVDKADEKLPDTFKEILTNEKLNDYYDVAVEKANTVLDGKAKIDFSISDASDILYKDGYDFDIQIKKGPSASLIFKIADDQANELLAAVEAKYPDAKVYGKKLLGDGYTVVLEDGSVPTFADDCDYAYKEVVSEKKITANRYGISNSSMSQIEPICGMSNSRG